ncbi:hypothetical protein SGUI_3142 [Serinicoccus hydrothermalis]|uniref:Uncharacterized protein n=1 Tax=Serinicoccus hydrothermalis TaxID=1758689 RepID=A0A1B1NGI7_9MICO|nr:hypothetical protein [Serinicoccus hydrothermalis]ANS80538.1 hypothetical protein SGUI_3142 [Serinicoccus hydrothermalis]
MNPPDTTRRTGLNRTVLLRPGAPWHGHRAGRVLGATGLSGAVAEAAAGAGVRIDDAPLATLDRSLTAGEDWAEAVAGAWTEAFTHLLRSLRTPTAADRAARAEWDERDWSRWAAVRRTVVCGGVVAGELGARAARDPRWVALGAELSPDPARASLLGLAAGLDDDGLVLDLGHSSIKAATVRGGVLAPTRGVPVPWQPFETVTWPSPEDVLGIVVGAARAALGDVVGAPDDGPLEVRVAIANYVVGGVLDEDDTYGTLRRLGPDPRDLLSRTLTRGLDRPCTVSLLVNDGAAAALGAHDPAQGQEPTAVISVGTSLGLGFAGA